MTTVLFLPFDLVRFSTDTGEYLEGYITQTYYYYEKSIFIFSILEINSGDIYTMPQENIVLIKRQLPFGDFSQCVSCNIFKHLTDDACVNYCPVRNKIYLPGEMIANKVDDRLSTAKFTVKGLRMLGFMPTSLSERTIRATAYGLPKPPPEFADGSFSGLLYILENQCKYYNLSDYISYVIHSDLTGNIVIDSSDIQNQFYRLRNINRSSISLFQIPCDYCIYKDTDSCHSCNFNNLIFNKERGVYVDGRTDREV